MDNLMSLYDYLGCAAGPKLGAFVWEKAQKQKINTSTREVNYKKYSGPVRLYPKEFLDEVFLEIDKSTFL